MGGGSVSTFSSCLGLPLFLLWPLRHWFVKWSQKLFPDGSVVKSLPANDGNAGDMSFISGSGRSPGEGNDNPLQYSCLGNPMD